MKDQIRPIARIMVASITEREDLLLSGNFGRAIMASFIDVDPETMATHLGISLEGPDNQPLRRRNRFLPHRSRRFRIRHYSNPDQIINDAPTHQLVNLINCVISSNYSDIAEQLVNSEILLNRIQRELDHFAFAGTENWHMFRPALLAGKESLRPIAQLLANNSELDWWWGDVEQDAQRWISQRNEEGLSNKELSDGFTINRSRETFSHLSDREFQTWWVTPGGDRISDTTFGPVGSALAVKPVCHDDWIVNKANVQVWKVTIPMDANIYEVHTPQDWIHLVERFPKLRTNPDTANWLRWTGCSGPWLVPDWKAVAEQFDGVHVSIGGHLSTAYTAWPIGDHFTILSGWHPDSTFWIGRSPQVVGERLDTGEEYRPPTWKRLNYLPRNQFGEPIPKNFVRPEVCCSTT
jgi:hypothetical protein